MLKKVECTTFMECMGVSHLITDTIIMLRTIISWYGAVANLTHFCLDLHIRKTCPCNVYPLEPHFYIAKLGYAGVGLFFLFLLQNIDCGYSLEPPR